MWERSGRQLASDKKRKGFEVHDHTEQQEVQLRGGRSGIGNEALAEAWRRSRPRARKL